MLITPVLLRDKELIKDLYTRLLPKVQSFIISNGGESTESEDIFQEALYALYGKAVEGLELTCDLQAYVFGMCKNLWLMRIRKRSSKAKYLSGLSNTDLEQEAFDAEFHKVEKQLLFEQHYQLLNEKCRKILDLFFSKIPMKEIAQRLNFSSEGSAKKAKHSCKKKLIMSIQSDPLFQELYASA